MKINNSDFQGILETGLKPMKGKEYLFSPALDYAGEKGYVDVQVEI